jgi:hypothetical protein
MTITREELKQLITEQIKASRSVLLEMPGMDGTYSYTSAAADDAERKLNGVKDPDDYEGESAKQKLYHISAQASQLEAIIKDDENLKPWVQDAITKASEHLETAFKKIMHDKRPGASTMEG